MDFLAAPAALAATAKCWRSWGWRHGPEEQDLSHVLAVASSVYVWLGMKQQTVRAVVKGLPARAWQVLSCGARAKAERLYEWALVPLLTIGKPGRQRWLLARRKLGAPQEMACYVVFGPKRNASGADRESRGHALGDRRGFWGGHGRSGIGSVRGALTPSAREGEKGAHGKGCGPASSSR